MLNPIEERKRLVQERIEKSFNDGINVTEEIELQKAHYDGEVHPNGKLVWVASANKGKGDWRKKKKGNAGNTDPMVVKNKNYEFNINTLTGVDYTTGKPMKFKFTAKPDDLQWFIRTMKKTEHDDNFNPDWIEQYTVAVD